MEHIKEDWARGLLVALLGVIHCDAGRSAETFGLVERTDKGMKKVHELRGACQSLVDALGPDAPNTTDWKRLRLAYDMAESVLRVPFPPYHRVERATK